MGLVQNNFSFSRSVNLFILILTVLLLINTSRTCWGQNIRSKRGFGSGYSHEAQTAGRNAVNLINQNQNIALWSAQSAVASAVGRDYQNSLATTAQFVNAFTVPVTKSQAGEAFKGVRNQQKGARIHAAQAGNSHGGGQGTRKVHQKRGKGSSGQKSRGHNNQNQNKGPSRSKSTDKGNGWIPMSRPKYYKRGRT